jgi:hypothetical protein
VNTPPARGTPDYHTLVRNIACGPTMQTMLHNLVCMRADYGWRGPVDVMTELIMVVEHLVPASLRDVTGVAMVAEFSHRPHTDDQLLDIMVRSSRLAVRANKTTAREAFEFAARPTERILNNLYQWAQIFTRALRLAATKDRDQVRAALVQGPGARDKHPFDVVQAGGYLYFCVEPYMTTAAEHHMSIFHPDDAAPFMGPAADRYRVLAPVDTNKAGSHDRTGH